MPVISKTAHPIVGDSNYMKIVKVDSSGEFSCQLPGSFSDILGYAVVKGKNLDELEGAFHKAVKTFTEASTTSREVIAYQINEGISHYAGVGASIVANIYTETTVTVNGESRTTLDRCKKCLIGVLTKGADSAIQYGSRDAIVVHWTQEREDFFNKVGSSLEGIRRMMGQLRNAESAAAIADGLQPFLPALTAGNPSPTPVDDDDD